MRFLWIVGGTTLLLSLGVTACGSDFGGLFGPGTGDPANEDDAASGGFLGSGGAPGTTGTPGSGGGASSTNSGGTDGTGGFGDPSGPMQSASSGSPASSAVSSSTSSGGGIAEIPCGNQLCSGTDVCCLHPFNPNMHSCQPGQCPQGQTLVECNNQFDCPSTQVCCGYFSFNNYQYREILCLDDCDSAPFGYTPYVMCEDDAAACPPGTSCNDSNILPDGYSYCG